MIPRALASLLMGISCLSAGLAAPAVAFAQSTQGLAPRQNVLFEINWQTSFGQSVFVVGDLPELGSNNTANAVKLSPTNYPVWRATVSLPAGRSYSYRFVTRNDGPGQQNSAANTISGPFNATTADQPRVTRSKALWLTWDIASPVMWWRPASPSSGGSFIRRPLERFGPAVAGRPNDTQWFTWGFHIGGEAFDFYFTDANGNARYPASGFYSTNLDGVFVQEGQLYTYVPAATVSAPRRDYNPSSLPAFFSTQLNQWRPYRVVLPRGYDQHPGRRYPVVYIHDGQNIFDQGSFGTWNAMPTLTSLQASGVMQEVIAVGIDNIGETRRSDYSAPGDNNGRADQYVAFIRDTLKPYIDANYRTLPDAPNTAALGSSMGGVVSLYMGYDFNSVFQRVGCLSTAWWLIPNYTNYIKAQPARANLRIYMDVGDTGSTSGGNNNDGYWDSIGVRDNFLAGTSPKYTIEGAYKFLIGYGQNHNETSWAARLPGALTFMFPAQGEPNALLRTLFSPAWDLNNDGAVDIEDLYAQNQSPRDLNSDGAINADDTAVLERFLRRNEQSDMRNGR
ncbi:MAG: alpha/beta hydrolase-fold protein [Planctomycetota bacterium]|nr:alpha/beta hydrolase-fold protein [Planctomycetota bacterium]